MNEALRSWIYHAIGLSILLLNKVRHTFTGYTRARPFPPTEFMKAAEHDRAVVEGWTKLLERYLGEPQPLKGRVILELGPGPDLGVGLLLLYLGAERYKAVDINDLVRHCPSEFYDVHLAHLANSYAERDVSIDALRRELESVLKGGGERLKYICNPAFDLSVVPEGEIDLVVSNAAFQQFDDVSRTIAQLSKLVRRGAVFIAGIDLKTHTRWIRERDPLNIYRYADAIYNPFKFSGSPNRWRPYEYERALAENGWTKIEVVPTATLAPERLASIVPHLDRKFQGDHNEMALLGVAVCATKA